MKLAIAIAAILTLNGCKKEEDLAGIWTSDPRLQQDLNPKNADPLMNFRRGQARRLRLRPDNTFLLLNGAHAIKGNYSVEGPTLSLQPQIIDGFALSELLERSPDTPKMQGFSPSSPGDLTEADFKTIKGTVTKGKETSLALPFSLSPGFNITLNRLDSLHTSFPTVSEGEKQWVGLWTAAGSHPIPKSFDNAQKRDATASGIFDSFNVLGLKADNTYFLDSTYDVTRGKWAANDGSVVLYRENWDVSGSERLVAGRDGRFLMTSDNKLVYQRDPDFK